MGAEEDSLRNKSLYKIELYLLKVMPMLLASIYYSEEAAILSGELAMQMLNEALCNIAEL